MPLYYLENFLLYLYLLSRSLLTQFHHKFINFFVLSDLI